MKTQNLQNLKNGVRGPVLKSEPGKAKISIRLDQNIIDYFMTKADESGGKLGYQTMINDILRKHIEGQSPAFEQTVRRVIREELGRAQQVSRSRI